MTIWEKFSIFRKIFTPGLVGAGEIRIKANSALKLRLSLGLALAVLGNKNICVTVHSADFYFMTICPEKAAKEHIKRGKATTVCQHE